jgi:glycerol uptake facilitator protein
MTAMPEAPAVLERHKVVPIPRAPAPRGPTLLNQCAAECLGTFLLVFLGCGVVHASVFAGAQAGLWQVAVVWGVAVALAIHATASISGGHLNPAMTAAFAAWNGFPRRHVLPYWSAQLTGAMLAAAALYGIFGDMIRAFELEHGIVRGLPGSERSACAYGEYFPNPGLGVDAAALAKVSELGAFAAECLATAILAFVVFALTEKKNAAAPGKDLGPALIGLTVAALISVVAPLTQACFNPARDFGPRLFAFLVGWGDAAIPGPRGGFFTVYILAPTIGALLGGLLFKSVFRNQYRESQ